MNKLISLILYFMCLMTCSAQQYDHVRSVRINGADVMKPIGYLELKRIAPGVPLVIKESVFSECTGNYDVVLDIGNPRVRLEYYQENNPSVSLETIFSRAPKNINDHRLKAKIWLDLELARKIQQTVYVDNIKITRAMTEKEFASRFPITMAASVSDHEKSKDTHVYEVIVDTDSRQNADVGYEGIPPYIPSIQFIFRNGVLEIFKVLQGVAC